MVPVLVFVYNRPFHTLKTLEALAQNAGAEMTDLIIYSDGAKKDTDTALVSDVRNICRKMKGFKSLTLHEREKNYGLAENIIQAVSAETNKHGEIIVLEDDLVTSPGFIDYMNQSLSFYRNTDVFSICAYSPPLMIPSGYSYSTYLAPRIGSWGWATWAEKWKQVDWEARDFDVFIRSKKERRKFEKGGNDLSAMLLRQKLNLINSWAIRFTYACFKLSQRVVYPCQSLVRNTGIDGSGTHMKKSSKYEALLQDQSGSWMFCPPDYENPDILKRFRLFYSTSAIRRIINILKINYYIIRSFF